MIGPKPIDGGPVPLFDRLTDIEPERRSESHPYRVLDRDGLADSVAVEVQRLLNTRAPVTAGRLASMPRTVLTYGIPDLHRLYVMSARDAKALTNSVAQAIEAYEPRLQEVKVSVSGADRARQRILLQIDARLRAGATDEPVSFPVAILDYEQSSGHDG